MYSEAEKVFWVQRMRAEGLTPGRAHKRWGGPSRAMLREWLRQAESGELAVPGVGVPHACPDHGKHGRYPEETRREALRRRALGESPADVARALGLPGGRVVSAWAAAERRRATMPAPAAPRGPAKGGGGGVGRERSRAATMSGRAPGEMGEAELRAELEAALERLAVLEEVVRDPKAGGPASLSNRQKAELGERLRRACGISLKDALSLLGISKSTYEYNRARLDAPPPPDDLGDLVEEAFLADGRGARGYRFVHAALARRGVRVSEKRVRRAMRERGLAPRRRARRPWSSYAGEVGEAPANLTLTEHMRHDFSAPAPDRLWLTDITEFGVPAGKLYLSPVIDCFDGAVVAWGLSEHPDGALADSMLAAAVATLPGGRAPAEGLALHSDRGVHYRRQPWYDACEAAGITRSMSRKGHSPDNSRMEGFFGTMKNEMFHGRDWSLATLGELRAEIEGYMSRFNSERLKYFRREGCRTATEVDTINGRRKRLGVKLAPS